MRAKAERLVITFQTTSAAMAMEKLCKAYGITGRLIPTPRQIHAGCGLAWSAPPGEEAFIREQMDCHGIIWESCRVLMI